MVSQAASSSLTLNGQLQLRREEEKQIGCDEDREMASGYDEFDLLAEDTAGVHRTTVECFGCRRYSDSGKCDEKIHQRCAGDNSVKYGQERYNKNTRDADQGFSKYPFACEA